MTICGLTHSSSHALWPAVMWSTRLYSITISQYSTFQSLLHPSLTHICPLSRSVSRGRYGVTNQGEGSSRTTLQWWTRKDGCDDGGLFIETVWSEQGRRERWTGLTRRECGVKINGQHHKQWSQQWCVRSRPVEGLCALCTNTEELFASWDHPF